MCICKIQLNVVKISCKLFSCLFLIIWNCYLYFNLNWVTSFSICSEVTPEEISITRKVTIYMVSMIMNMTTLGFLHGIAVVYVVVIDDLQVSSAEAALMMSVTRGVMYGSGISTKRRRSCPVLWQKPLHQQKCQKGKVTTQTTPQKSSIQQQLRTDLRTVSWSNYSHPTGVVNLVYGPTFPLPATAV